LEDINLAGAQGILVNITAGMDMAIGEFEEVGNTVKQFASDDATVVIGTVIEPEMQEELRVTVVATGLNRSAPRLVQPAAAITRAEPTMRMVRKQGAGTSTPDYSQLERPAIQRKSAVGDGLRPEVDGDEVLDIPAFLRRQAD
ncbi:MAG TPA: cell division protein FtsZ, partial [Steroidobacteraceae bacterium]|nr:cell division protein FtsZ [Steroidobacteraceae bacterium]